MKHLKISSSQIARICNVSQGTVDRALNNRPDLVKQRQKNVIECMVEVEYITEDEGKEILGEE